MPDFFFVCVTDGVGHYAEKFRWEIISNVVTSNLCNEVPPSHYIKSFSAKFYVMLSAGGAKPKKRHKKGKRTWFSKASNGQMADE